MHTLRSGLGIVGPLSAAAVLGILCSAITARGELTPEEIVALQKRGVAEGWTFAVGENPATKRPMEELCGLRVPEEWWKDAPFDPCDSPNPLPDYFDWRDYGGCTPVRNQGGCGSCWAFATVGPLECNILIKDGTQVDLSEQWLVSCNHSGWSCAGGWWAHSYHEWNRDPCDDSGAVLEEFFPYVAWDAPCQCPYPHDYWIDGWAHIGYGTGVPPSEAIKQAILDYGPVCVGVAVDSAFGAYTGGVFNACYNGDINHGVVLVGWDDNQGSEGVWFMRNSWGSGWGEAGYMRIEYGCSLIGYAASYVDYPGGDVLGNFDFDRDVDLLDYAQFLDCFTGPGGGPVPLECRRGDFDYDGDIDVGDFAGFQAAFTGDCDVIITQQPVGTFACPGDRVVLEVQAQGQELTYQWQHYYLNIPDATDPTLVIDPVMFSSAGPYRVSVIGKCGAAMSEIVELEVPAAPHINNPPESARICPGQTAEFTVQATGYELLTYQWRLNGYVIPGETEPTCIVASAGPEHLGQYRCAVTDACTTTTMSLPAVLSFHSAVVFDTHPAGGTYCVGETVVLYVIVQGATGYQWYKDDEAIPGANDFFMQVLDAQVEDSGAYHVEATGQCDSAVSDEAVVEVIPCNPGP